jgi:hypothetical protein
MSMSDIPRGRVGTREINTLMIFRSPQRGDLPQHFLMASCTLHYISIKYVRIVT